MSYTPDDQQLEPGIEKTLHGIRLLTEAIRERLLDRERWSAEHLAEIAELRRELVALETKLLDMR